MKRLLVLVLIVLMYVTAMAVTLERTHAVEHKFTLAEINTNIRDSTFFYFPIYGKQIDPVLYYYRVFRLREIDSAFVNDTVRFIWHVGLTDAGPWAAYDTNVVAVPATSRDTTVALGGRFKLDSTALLFNNNWLRCTPVYKFTIGATASDTALIGRRYGLEMTAWLIGRY